MVNTVSLVSDILLCRPARASAITHMRSKLLLGLLESVGSGIGIVQGGLQPSSKDGSASASTDKACLARRDHLCALEEVNVVDARRKPYLETSDDCQYGQSVSVSWRVGSYGPRSGMDS